VPSPQAATPARWWPQRARPPSAPSPETHAASDRSGPGPLPRPVVSTQWCWRRGGQGCCWRAGVQVAIRVRLQRRFRVKVRCSVFRPRRRAMRPWATRWACPRAGSPAPSARPRPATCAALRRRDLVSAPKICRRHVRSAPLTPVARSAPSKTSPPNTSAQDVAQRHGHRHGRVAHELRLRQQDVGQRHDVACPSASARIPLGAPVTKT